MFFLFSKVFAFLVTPVFWIILLLLVAIFLSDPQRQKKWLMWAFSLLLIFTNPFLLDETMRIWEVPAVSIEEVEPVEYGIVLGGMSTYDQKLDRAQFYRGVDRLIQSVDLYRKGIIKKIVFTGGSGSVLHQEIKEGNYIRRYLLFCGVPERDFIIESESRNTRENALFTANLFPDRGDQKFLLITSAFHMRRSLGCFRRAGFQVMPYSTDRYAGPRKFEFDHLFIPNSSTLNDWNVLIHEISGYLVYKSISFI